ncbi:MAG: insulinase family protein [bacterium]|nr:insulinase family protein [bacterium]
MALPAILRFKEAHAAIDEAHAAFFRFCSRATLLLVVVAASVATALAVPGDTVALNSKILTGKLTNGATYYIMRNKKPEKRLELVLAVDAGAVLEDDDQNGLAHFAEHMAFNGTKSFPKQELVSFLESTGIRFGADLNAYTNQDETVYQLTVPLDNAQNIIKAIQVLRDWAGYVSYDDAEIEAERGVVTEEWRLRRGAGERVNRVHSKVLLAGSKYADRDVIGDTAVLKHAPADNLRRFYKTWYQPERMAVILVGDYDEKDLESLLKKHFAFPAGSSGGSRARANYPITVTNTTRVSIASDKELPGASVDIYTIGPRESMITKEDFRRSMTSSLVTSMLNSRLSEMTQKANAPFAFAGTATFGLTRANNAFYAQAISADKNILPSLRALLTEMRRVEQKGFSQTELDRAKAEVYSSMEKAYNERDKTPNANHAAEFTRNFLIQEASPGIAREFELYKEILPTVTLSDVTGSATKAITNAHRIITVSVPEGNGYIKPTEAEVLAVVRDVEKSSVTAYIDDVPLKPLMSNTPTPGTIVSRSQLSDVGAEQWTLSNGAKVVVKQTDFKDDEILFSAWSYGGESLGDERDQATLGVAASIVDAGGLGEFSTPMLTKMLQGKNISLSPGSGMETFDMSGSTSLKDLHSFFEVLHLTFTSPRLDEEAATALKARMRAGLANKETNPEAVFFDTVTVVSSGNHPRMTPMSVATVDKIDAAKAYAFVKKSVENAGAYTFYFVGNFSKDTLENYVKTYIASLPSTSEKPMWKDAGIRMKTGKIERTVLKGIEAKSAVVMTYSGPFKYSPEERYNIIALTEVMSTRLREQLREEKGGVYFVAVQPSMNKIPVEDYSITVYFTCEPNRVDELVSAVRKEVDYLQNNVVDASYIQKIKEIQSKEREVSRKSNQFWLGSIKAVQVSGEPLSVIGRRDELIKALTPEQVKEAARKYLATSNTAIFVLKPEK